MTINLTPSEVDRFWSKVQKRSPDDCWLWATHTNNQGYGRFTTWRKNRRRRFLAHRIAYQLVTGEPIDGKVLLHRCDTPRCCNPNHLKPGTQADNIADARAKGRMVPPPIHRGEASSRARLTAAQVAEIRRRYAAGGVLQRELAAEYGVTQTAISAVVRGQTWAVA